MITSKQHIGFSRKLISLAVLAAFSPAYAAEGDGVSQATGPQGTVSAGVGIASGNSKDRALFGQYNGLRSNSEHLLLDADVVNQNDATGVRTTFQGRNLGLDDRELGFAQQKQGDWKYSVDYGELTRHDPRTINTGMLGAGTATPTVVRLPAQGSGSELELDTRRKSVSLAAEKWLSPSLMFEANFKSEDKDGARLFGRGLVCTAAEQTRLHILCPSLPITNPATMTGGMLMLPEPINSNTKQLDAKLNFSGDKFLVSAAYYGSFYTNNNGSLNPTVSGNLWNPNGSSFDPTTPVTGVAFSQVVTFLQQPMALPPDNQAHQLSLAGHYAFTPTTRATFKYAKTHATQNENFGGMGLTTRPAGVNDLGGVVDTTLTQLGLTARPTAKLSVLANLRYEDRDDKTPVNLYGVSITGVSGATNVQGPLTRVNGKLEASYQLPSNYRATLGVDYATVDRGATKSTEYLGGLSMLREETREQGWRAELRRTMSETLNAGISYTSSRRDGSSWLECAVGIKGCNPVTDAVAAALSTGLPYTSYMLMDRKRDKLKLSADWSPTEKLTLQFMLEDGKDKYTEPHNGAYAKSLNDTGMRLFSVDATFALSDEWRLTGYVSQGEQTLHVNHSAYMAEVENINTSVGLGVRGKPSARLEVGGDLSYMNDQNHYGQRGVTAANQTTLNALGGLPDVMFRQSMLKLFGKYALEKNADVRVDLVYQHASLNEWTWQNPGTSFAYSDYTTVSMKQTQNVGFIGATYIYKLK